VEALSNGAAQGEFVTERVEVAFGVSLALIQCRVDPMWVNTPIGEEAASGPIKLLACLLRDQRRLDDNMPQVGAEVAREVDALCDAQSNVRSA
jgi:hypothetical protein